jgi:predicted transcriptional regulator
VKLRKEQKLGERELDILQALWRLRSATVAEVQAALFEVGHEVAYTTVQTMLNRLEAKGYVARDGSDRAHRYRPRLKETTTVGGAVERLVDRFFGGSTEELAAHLVEKNLDADQLDRLQALIDRRRRMGRKK